MIEFETKVRACLAQASQMYGVDMSCVEISYKLKGRMAGMSCYDRGHFVLKFNRDAIIGHWDHMINSTIPHEVAHMVGTIARFKGASNPEAQHIKGHNWFWRKAAIRLGDVDRGKRTHDLPLKKSRKQNRFSYVDPISGIETVVSATIHNRIQKGYAYGSFATGKAIRPEHFKGFAKVDTDKLLEELGI